MLEAWKEFRCGKRTKLDVLEFQSDLIYQVTKLHEELKEKTYKHGGYKHFKISDPKPRDIYKASVRDRLLHHAIYRILYPYFDKTFINDSYSCRLGKGTHRAMNRFRAMAYQVSKNHTRTAWVLKCDIKKFFASIDHTVLAHVLKTCISDSDIFRLLQKVIGSFVSDLASESKIPTFCRKPECLSKGSPCSNVGLPLGNLTSQLLVNIYMNEFDQFVKHTLKAKHYIRYADDFIFLSHDRQELERSLRYIVGFVQRNLKLRLHPDKVYIKTFASGVDFLGWVHFPDHRVLRTATKRRMFRRIVETGEKKETIDSYLGLLSHGNVQQLAAQVQKLRKE